MLTSKIRLRYTGLTLFASKGVTLLASFAYVLAVTRNLSEHDFGVMQNIGDVIPYLTLAAGILPEWASRFVARKIRGAAMTVLIANLALGVLFAVVGLASAWFFAKIAHSIALYYAIASIQVLEFHLMGVFEGVAYGSKPHILGYARILHDITRVILALPLIVYLKLGILGALVAIIGTYVVDLAFYAIMLRDLFRESVQWKFLGAWSKSSILSIYSIIAVRIGSLDMILLIIYAGTAARAYVGAASAVSTMVGYASVISMALYPRLLSGGGADDVETSLAMTLLFAIPMGVGTLILAKPFLIILNPVYEVALPILYVLIIGALVQSVGTIMDTTISGTEKVDATGAFSFKELIKSRLTLVPTLSYVYSIIYFPLVWLGLNMLAGKSLEAALYCSMLSVLIGGALVVYKWKIAQRLLKLRLPLQSIGKYVVASAVMAVVILIFPQPAKITATLGLVVVGSVTYIGTLALIEKNFRIIIRATIEEVQNRLGYHRRRVVSEE